MAARFAFDGVLPAGGSKPAPSSAVKQKKKETGAGLSFS